MNKKIFFFGFIFFMIFFVLNTVIEKYTGYVSRRDFSYFEPVTWEKYFEELPKLLIASLIVSIISTFIYLNAKKDKIRIEEAARKRIENKEKARINLKKQKKNNPSDEDDDKNELKKH